jgi:ribosome-binding protein aMBF1 (putative translation factor)
MSREVDYSSSNSDRIQEVSKSEMIKNPKTRKDVLQRFGDKLQKARKAKGMSQEDLAARLVMHRSYVGMIERGERNPTITTLYEIAKALKVSAFDLLPF